MGEVLHKGAMGHGAREARARGDDPAQLGLRVGGGDDCRGIRENTRHGWRQREISGGPMKARERATRRSGVVETGEGVPRRHVAVEIHAGSSRVDLVKEVAV